MTRVTVIRQEGSSVLVEYEDEGALKRVTVPDSALGAEVDTGTTPPTAYVTVDSADLAAGVPYGADWESVVLVVDAAAVADALRRRGIWTVEDASADPAAVQSALRQVYRLDVKTIRDFGG